MECARRDELTEKSQKAIQKIIDISQRSRAALGLGDESLMRQLDQELEMTMGEKERALGALRQHQQEHGCGVKPIDPAS